MKTKLLFISLLFLSFSIVLAQKTQKWTFEMYSKYTITTFYEFEEINKKIDVNNLDTTLMAAAIFYATNRQRVIHKKKPLKPSEGLFKAAQEHSYDMGKHNFFSHQSPLEHKESVRKRVRQYISEYYRVSAGENIAGCSWKGKTYLSLASKLLEMWMNSPGHRENILNPRYTFLGCGITFEKEKYKRDYGYVKATQNFMRFFPKDYFTQEKSFDETKEMAEQGDAQAQDNLKKYLVPI